MCVAVSYTHLDVYKRQEKRVCFDYMSTLFLISFVNNVVTLFLFYRFTGCYFEIPVSYTHLDVYKRQEDGTLTGEVKFILYKGDHYHLTVFSD